MYEYETKQKDKTDKSGIPVRLKHNFEKISRQSFDDVRVHYNSDRPAKLNALAYTQNNNVYLAPGQEKHLSHELGHVVQQKRQNVKMTTRINGYNVNDSKRLESEADSMGAQAIQMRAMINKKRQDIEVAKRAELAATFRESSADKTHPAHGREGSRYRDPAHSARVSVRRGTSQAAGTATRADPEIGAWERQITELEAHNQELKRHRKPPDEGIEGQIAQL